MNMAKILPRGHALQIPRESLSLRICNALGSGNIKSKLVGETWLLGPVSVRMQTNKQSSQPTNIVTKWL